MNAYIHVCRRHIKNVIVLDIYRKFTDEVQGNWEAFYENKLLQPNQEEGAPLMNDLINLAVDFYMQDKREIIGSNTRNTSHRLTSVQAEDSIICIRKFRKLMKQGLIDPVSFRQHIKIDAARQTDELLPDVRHKGITNFPPYMEQYEAKEGSRIAFLSHLLQEKIMKKNARLKNQAW